MNEQPETTLDRPTKVERLLARRAKRLRDGTLRAVPKPGPPPQPVEHWPLDEYQDDLERLRKAGWRITIAHRRRNWGFASVTRFRCTHPLLLDQAGIACIHLARSRFQLADRPDGYMDAEVFLEAAGGSIRGVVPRSLGKALQGALRLAELRALRAFIGLRDCVGEIMPPPRPTAAQAGDEGAP
jgi:hypothetical protein